MTNSALRLSALVLSISTFSDAFTLTPSQLPIKVTSASSLRVSKTSESIPDLSSSTKPVDESNIFSDSAGDDADDSSWQKNLDQLLAPDTSVAARQIVLSDLLSSTDAIQESVRTALRERKIDGLLTPNQKRLQDGTRAVARQLTSDILPGIAAVAAGAKKSPNGAKKLKSPVDVLVEDLPTVVPKIGSRVLNALSNQAQKNLEEFQEDIKAGDPLRSITRIQEQTAEFAAEAKNVFMETPEGLVGPPYRVLSQGEGYEIREYDSYNVASTSMSPVDDPYTMDDLASSGEAFNALAAYLFGANDEKEVMEMTTPVATTSLGEMRFYLKEREGAGSSFPMPVAENDEIFNEKGAVKIQEIPSATLAVAKFTGFVTEGEVERQKDALMTCLAIDGIEIDVPHASVVPHVIFQYNPPYTIPILRRNEIGIPVMLAAEEEEDDLSQEWDVEDVVEEA
eukprot:CAMPEP_0201884500 /NCGR_PEP_ID=MMETSP0902-20130614/17325_1 /ASSEMBLY_ACC=CAM_ASM_000551 /TAXON_ID=420261 /ORGANISM="Thalassiosira antarctica, Strain CCMP982" /LENGTH=452 /DNA_ID=CAMNT_0048413479 /DNA_START=72 /DNA_END=1430 /DNA_ORIENTATION=+